MTMSMHVIGIIPPDGKYERMKEIWDMCKTEDVTIPKEVIEFFGGDNPTEYGREVFLDHVAEEYREDNEREGLKIEIARIPEHIKSIVFYVSW